jgi:hypothetical protein
MTHNYTDEEIRQTIERLGDGGWVERGIVRAAIGNPTDGYRGFNLNSIIQRLVDAGRVETNYPQIPNRIRAVRFDNSEQEL